MASRMGQLARVDQRAASYKFESSDSTSKCNVDLELHPLSFCWLFLSIWTPWPIHWCLCACTCRRLRGRVGGDTQPRPKPRPITSPDRPGLPDFSRITLKSMGRSGYEASSWYSLHNNNYLPASILDHGVTTKTMHIALNYIIHSYNMHVCARSADLTRHTQKAKITNYT